MISEAQSRGDKQDDSNLLLNFAERLKMCALKRGFKQKTLAERSGVSSQGIGKYWNAQQFPKALQLFQISDALNVDARWLATGKGSMPAPDAINDSAAAAEPAPRPDDRNPLRGLVEILAVVVPFWTIVAWLLLR